jgi:5-formyltetrahydrofolate cyclo-ligase
MSVVVDLKAIARKHALGRRKIAHEAAKDTGAGLQACTLLMHFLSRLHGQVVAGYMPIRTEIDPRPAMELLSQKGRECTLALPVVEAQAQPLRFDTWGMSQPLKEGAFGAAIPEQSVPVTPAVVIVPLVAFNRSGHRLGYGGGFYDRTLEVLRAGADVFAVGLAYSGQEMSDFPTSPTDAALDAIVTENEVLTF